MNYPNGIQKNSTNNIINYGNRGMVLEDDLNITLPTTLTSMKLDKETNIYTLTFISENSNTVLTLTLKIRNNMKLIQEISYL